MLSTRFSTWFGLHFTMFTLSLDIYRGELGGPMWDSSGHGNAASGKSAEKAKNSVTKEKPHRPGSSNRPSSSNKKNNQRPTSAKHLKHPREDPRELQPSVNRVKQESVTKPDIGKQQSSTKHTTSSHHTTTLKVSSCSKITGSSAATLNSTYTLEASPAWGQEDGNNADVKHSESDDSFFGEDFHCKSPEEKMTELRAKVLRKMIDKLNVEQKLRDFRSAGRKAGSGLIMHANEAVGEELGVRCDPAVYIWLKSLQLRDTMSYARIFGRYDIDIESLQLLTDAQLKDMGLTADGPRRKIIAAIEELRRVVAAESAALETRLLLSTQQKGRTKKTSIGGTDSPASNGTLTERTAPQPALNKAKAKKSMSQKTAYPYKETQKASHRNIAPVAETSSAEHNKPVTQSTSTKHKDNPPQSSSKSMYQKNSSSRTQKLYPSSGQGRPGSRRPPGSTTSKCPQPGSGRPGAGVTSDGHTGRLRASSARVTTGPQDARQQPRPRPKSAVEPHRTELKFDKGKYLAVTD